MMRDTLLIQVDKRIFRSEFGNAIMDVNGDKAFLFNEQTSRLSSKKLLSPFQRRAPSREG